MDITNYKYFKYEMALGTPLPMPAPKLDLYPENQYSVQQFLLTVCKEHVGTLGKKGSKWCFGDDVVPNIDLGPRSDITQIFDYAEKLGALVPKPDQSGGGEDTFVIYQLSEKYWNKFDKFSS